MLRIKLISAFRANAVRELSFGIFGNEDFDLIPITLIISYLFA